MLKRLENYVQRYEEINEELAKPEIGIIDPQPANCPILSYKLKAVKTDAINITTSIV